MAVLFSILSVYIILLCKQKCEISQFLSILKIMRRSEIFIHFPECKKSVQTANSSLNASFYPTSFIKLLPLN
jgi:hypothetical protein